MSGRKKIPDWIVLAQDEMKCLRCGLTRPIYLPAAIDDFTKQAQAFAETHKFCKVPGGEGPGGEGAVIALFRIQGRRT